MQNLAQYVWEPYVWNIIAYVFEIGPLAVLDMGQQRFISTWATWSLQIALKQQQRKSTHVNILAI
jgi:hypothetical protein